MTNEIAEIAFSISEYRMNGIVWRILKNSIYCPCGYCYLTPAVPGFHTWPTEIEGSFLRVP